MFSAIFKDQTVFIISASIAVLLAAAICYLLAHRMGTRPWSCAGLGAAVTAEVALTLFLPSGDGVSGAGKCVLNRNYAEPFATEQGLLNLALFMPVGVFGILALRRLLPVLAGGIGLSLATELLQTLLPGVSRGCDSSDLQMNALGAAAGALGTWWVLRSRDRALPADAAAKPTAMACVAALVVTAVTWTLWITPVPVDATTLQLTGDKERTAAEKALSHALGDRFSISAVQLRTGTQGESDSLLITLEAGSAELSWPDTSRLTVSLENSSLTSPASFPVDGVIKPPANEKDALDIARRYAQARYPWGLRDTKVQAVSVGERGELGWIVSWRRLNDDGVLMPMRLDVQINTAGRVSQLLVHDIDDPKALPAPTVNKKKAADIALRTLDATQQANNVRVQDCGLRAVDHDGTWRTHWVCAFQSDDPSLTLMPVSVDAVTGKPQEQQQPQELQPPSGELSDGPPGENGPGSTPQNP
ncbi:VanZ family protein [Streptomyces sp. Wb2n-11]|uniref:VanZ family protein n=1 Tax=Streptomyces sp. Wb2n-11 TaxID=1030533 RepID=UPI000B0B27AE|nr:VanZ family protein [Streptomyces sp. Wb2n-11]